MRTAAIVANTVSIIETLHSSCTSDIYDLTILTYIELEHACAVKSTHGIARCGR